MPSQPPLRSDHRPSGPDTAIVIRPLRDMTQKLFSVDAAGQFAGHARPTVRPPTVGPGVANAICPSAVFPEEKPESGTGRGDSRPMIG
jgi:hypothetical protein